MNIRIKNGIGTALAVVLVLGLVLPGFSMYVGNTSEIGFVDAGTGSGPMGKTSGTSGFTIEDLVIKSATYFLKGKAKIYLLSSKLEAADHDGVWFYEYQVIVNDALDNMKMARYYYQLLINKADRTPYNQGVISQLKAFDYKSFSKEYGVNTSSFNQVKNYLAAGDVRGAYVRLYTYTDNIINILDTLRKEIYCRNFPETSNIWRLNQECANMLLFGQYMAQVFYSVN
ncbi:MAG: hypothetical protein GY757_56985 [bacterium]|nr:hypothetical protein [bacterium]